MALELDPEQQITIVVPLGVLRGIRDELAWALARRGQLLVSGIHSNAKRDAEIKRWVGILTLRIERAERDQE